uniref:SecY-type transporter protein n=1 Tax=Toxarium undulatum TaxID=210620 RepID=A0A1D8DCA2_9STRA|nr:SecY-type transporter protein [Toxarium undulatum]AOS86663.1 SecY-type transporter protein [Toxarium undulatum]
MKKQKNKTAGIIRTRFLLSLAILLFIRIGTNIPIPGINYQQLFFYLQSNILANNLIQTFSGNKGFTIGLFALNIVPYINASILIQLLISFVPKIANLRKEGIYGKRILDRITRLITLGIAVLQSGIIAFSLKNVLYNWNYFLAFQIILSLTTGAMIVFWLSEFITEYGLGNGPSLLISFNILSNFSNILGLLIKNNNLSINIGSLIIGIILFFVALLLVILLQLSWVKIPIISSKLLNSSKYDISAFLEEDNNYIPLRYDTGGVLPIILTTSVLYGMDLFLLPMLKIPILSQCYQLFYWVLFFILNGIFNSTTSILIINPTNLSNELKENAVSIKEISTESGLNTPIYLKSQVIRAAFTGSIFLSLIGVLSNLMTLVLPLPGFSKFGLTSLLILVNVISSIYREVQNIIISNIYDDQETSIIK